jgi:hypothetical protein
LNEVLPKDKQVRLQKIPASRLSRSKNCNTTQFTSSEKLRAASLSKVSSLMQSDITNKHLENKVKTIDFRMRCKAFDTLRAIALNLNQAPDTTDIDQDKYEYLKDIHEGQNEITTFASTEIYQIKSVATNSPLSVISSRSYSDISTKSV